MPSSERGEWRVSSSDIRIEKEQTRQLASRLTGSNRTRTARVTTEGLHPCTSWFTGRSWRFGGVVSRSARAMYGSRGAQQPNTPQVARLWQGTSNRRSSSASPSQQLPPARRASDAAAVSWRAARATTAPGRSKTAGGAGCAAACLEAAAADGRPPPAWFARCQREGASKTLTQSSSEGG